LKISFYLPILNLLIVIAVMGQWASMNRAQIVIIGPKLKENITFVQNVKIVDLLIGELKNVQDVMVQKRLKPLA
jgi:hypothetical protein